MRASQLWRFFCVVPPGHEAAALEEFQAKSSMLSSYPLTATAINGGLELETSCEIGRGLVHVLKIPTRVLIRLKTFPARDFPKMYNALRDLPWNQWLQHPTPTLRVSAHQCRLIHTGRVEEAFHEALKAAHQRQPFSTRYETEKLAPDLLLIRGDNDQWTISLDLAGDALYKRGEFAGKGEAPIRETHAAAVLWHLFKDYQGPAVMLVDPMCGSGTLLREAVNFFQPTQNAFAYLTSPVNKGVAPWKTKSTMNSWPIEAALGFDINSELVNKLKGEEKLKFATHDVLQNPTIPTAGAPCWLISNPPYGDRLAVAQGLKVFAEKLSHSLSLYHPARAAFIVPQTFPSITLAGLKLYQAYPFSNGGIAVEARVFR